MSRKRNNESSDDDYDEVSEKADYIEDYIKANKEFHRQNKWLDERNHELESKVKSLERVITALKQEIKLKDELLQKAQVKSCYSFPLFLGYFDQFPIAFK